MTDEQTETPPAAKPRKRRRAKAAKNGAPTAVDVKRLARELDDHARRLEREAKAVRAASAALRGSARRS